MSGAIEPKVPAEGWEIRWLKQSADLALRVPIMLGLLLLASILVGMVAITAATHLGGTMMLFGIMAVFPALMAGVIVGGVALVQQADQRLEASRAEIIARIRHAILVVLVVNACFYAFNGIIDHVAHAISPPSPDRHTKGPVFSFFEMVLGIGSVPLGLAMSAGFIIMPFWLAELARSGIRARPALFVAMRIWTQRELLKIAVIKILFVMILPMLPPYFIVPAFYFFVIWDYVATREIFGGIGENKKETAREGQSRRAFSGA